MTGNPEKITNGADHLGQTCIVCQGKIETKDEVITCPRCRSLHHVECWKSKGGCGKAGCPQIAQAVRGERPAGDGPPPPVSKRVVLGGIVAVLALILLMILWPKPPDPALGRTRIVFLGEAYYDLTETMNKLAENYNATSEEIYIDLQLLPPGGMDTKLIVLIAANQAPDVLAIDEARYAQFHEEAVMLPLGADAAGTTLYGIQHPAQLSQLVVWGNTQYPTQALEVLYYFAGNIPAADLDLLREAENQPFPFGM